MQLRRQDFNSPCRQIQNGERDGHLLLFLYRELKRDAQGRYLEQMLGDRAHLLTERTAVIILGGAWVKVFGKSRKCFGMMVAREGVEPPTPAFSGLRSTT